MQKLTTGDLEICYQSRYRDQYLRPPNLRAKESANEKGENEGESVFYAWTSIEFRGRYVIKYERP